ncbi:MAG TPA: sulfite exporter TauE/SafE family protein [Deltaproteobacteria bacterium]|nr:sulfite exporter TauE/SafE family protein [Deltaproteobacteria bacterium]
MAGGGSFLSLSAMIWLGLPADVANATNRVGVLVQSVAAAAAFQRRGVEVSEPLWPTAAAVCLGATAGAGLSVILPPELFERLLAATMLVMLGVTLLRPRSWLEPGEARRSRWPALVAAGAYGGFLQAGVGVLLLAVLVLLGGLEPVRANARKVALVALLTLPALAIYVAWGLVDWPAGALLAVGSAVGGALGSRLTVGAGAWLVWGAVGVVVVATATRLFMTG